MSYLTPRTHGLDLGIDLTALAALQAGWSGSAGPDWLQAALLAEQAGADALHLSLLQTPSAAAQDQLMQLAATSMTGLHLTLPLQADMLALACQLRPQSVCLQPGPDAPLASQSGVIRDALASLRAGSIEGILSLPAQLADVAAAAETGVTVIALQVAGAPAEQIATCASAAVRLGLRVQLCQGVDYQNAPVFAAMPDLSQLTVGRAILGHAIFVGWQNAVREMKAILMRPRA